MANGVQCGGQGMANGLSMCEGQTNPVCIIGFEGTKIPKILRTKW